MMEETKFIVWYKFDGEEDFMVITAIDEDEARRRFYSWHSGSITDIHEIEENELYLAYL